MLATMNWVKPKFGWAAAVSKNWLGVATEHSAGASGGSALQVPACQPESTLGSCGLLGAMTGLGISEEEAREYEKQFHEGKAILTVRAGEHADEVVQIIRRHGGFVRRDEIPPGGPQAQPPLIA